jgi:hypothetical protein
VNVNAAGPHASTFGPLLKQPSLPSAPFSVSGTVEFDDAGYQLDSVVVELAGNRVVADGTVSRSDNLLGTDLQLDFAAPDLGDVGQLISQTGLVELPKLPREPFSVSGRVTIDDDGYGLRGIEGTLGTAVGRIDGRVGLPPGFRGTDLSVHADGPNASLITALTGVSVPLAPFQVDGRVERRDEGYRFHNLYLRLGEYSAQANGRLGELPKLIGTDFEARASGPSLLPFSQLAGVSYLPDHPFEIVGSFDGNPRRFKSDDFRVRVGPSDVAGTFRVDLAGKPKIKAEFRSETVNVKRFFAERAATKAGQRAELGETAEPSRRKNGLVISEKPFELGILHKVDADLLWSIEEFVLPLDRFSDIEIDVILEDGRLQAGPLAVTGSGGGHLDVDLELKPVAAGHTLHSKLLIDDVRMSLSRNDEYRDQRPTIDVDLQYGGTGRSPHEIAASANGRVQMVVGEGVMDKSIVNLVAADILVALLDAFNPFNEEKPVTELECAVMVFSIEDGVAVLDPMAVRTDVMTIVGGGKIDFSTEKLSLDWVTKPRKGIGISASMITNPYIRLGGTLGSPNLAMKPLEAMTSTGLAVATGGLSILGKGLWDRITAEQNVCKQALKKVEKRQRKTEKN